MWDAQSKIVRTDSGNEDFRQLVKHLDRELAVFDGDDHAYYAQYNGLHSIKHALVYYVEDMAVGCGSFKKFDDESVEIKRMYVKELFRKQGIAWKILQELENWAYENDYKYSILETGKRQMEAIGLYMKSGYEVIPNYGQYIEMENSVCMRKKLN
ncbi:MAG: GNAT family N-acetyltransferase [Bacteroidota bacterium]